MIGWTPELRGDTISLVRPLPWARPLDGLRFEPTRWGPGAFRLETALGAHLLIRRHGAAELALWLPACLSPRPKGSFGLYLHADHHFAHRARAAGRLRQAVGIGQPLRPHRHRHAHRLVAMLYIHDRVSAGLSLRDIAAELLTPMPGDWRSSSERSDLRRLADAAAAMVAGGYRALLTPGRHARG